MENNGLVRCKSWHDWLTEAVRSSFPTLKRVESESIEKRDENIEGEANWEMWLVPSPMPRNVTASQLREASMLVRDGFCTKEEVARLKETVMDTSNGPFEENVADGLMRLSEAYEASKEVRDRSRAAVDRGLYPTGSEGVRSSAAKRTARLASSVALSLSRGELDSNRMASVLDGAGLMGEKVSDGAAARLILLGQAAVRSELTRAQSLQLNHVLHATVTLVLSCDLEELQEEDDAFHTNEKVMVSKVKVLEPLSSVRLLPEDDVNWEPVLNKKRRMQRASNPRFDDYERIIGRTLPYLSADGVVRYYESRTRRGLRLERCDRVWAVSDLHADVEKNREWVQALPVRPGDAIIVAGDIASKLVDLGAIFKLLASKYKYVFYTVGNHELFRTPPGSITSIHKLFEIFNLCDALGIITTAAFLGPDVLIAPLFSWYRRRGPDAGLLEFFDAACVWPWQIESSLDDAVADFFFKLNEGTLKFCADIRSKLYSSSNSFSNPPLITFSHFVPHLDHLFPGFAAFRHVMGAPELDEQVNTLAPLVHVFGHSHINVDEIVHGTRFVQNALGHPQETPDEQRAALSPLLVWAKAATLRAAISSPRCPPPRGLIVPIQMDMKQQAPLTPPLHIDEPLRSALTQQEDYDDDRPFF